MSLPRIIVKRIIKELTENLPELVSDFIVSVCESLQCSRVVFSFLENSVSVKFMRDNEEILVIEVRGKGKEVLEQVYQLFTQTT